MVPLLAAIITALGIAWVSRLSRNKGAKISKALWIPTIWLLIGSSRPVSGWISGQAVQGTNYEDGSPLDRTLLIILIALALFVLSKRTRSIWAILRVNYPIAIFLLYCFLSIAWSDFPFVTFKRWIRGGGDLVMILLILTERNWEDGFKWVLEKIAYLLIPLSVLTIRYFPDYGRSYTISGAQMWTGVCTDKNGLGGICMIFGSAILWRLLRARPASPASHGNARERIARGVVFTMTLYLMWVIDSKTALVCFLIANALIVLTWFGPRFRKPAILTAAVSGILIACYCLLFLGIGGGALETMGRNSTLTGRTEIWATVLPLAENPLLGAGYENFWMGERFATVARNLAILNQAHNGYLEIYLNLGWIGLTLLGILIVTGWRNLVSGFRSNVEMSRLKLAVFTVCLVYNFTEATFKMNSPVWFTFLWAAMASPRIRSLNVQPPPSAAETPAPELVPAGKSNGWSELQHWIG